MPVKPIAIILALSALLWGCGEPRRTAELECSDMVLSQSRAGRYTSLFDSGSSLTAVFSNWESGSLSIVDVSDSEWSRTSALNGRYFRPEMGTDFNDKIDVAPIQAPDFGEHTCAVIGSSLSVLYADRRNEQRPILKLLTRGSSGAWHVDVLEPAGKPVALLPDERGNPQAFWASGSLFRSGFSGRSGTQTVLSPFTPASAGCASGQAFTVYDLVTRRLLCISMREYAIQASEIPGGQPLQHSILTAQCSLAVMTYSPQIGRILLLERKGEKEEWLTTTVAFSEDTRSLFFTPYGAGYLFLFDSVVRDGSGESSHALFILVPNGRRYDRYLVWGARKPIMGFSAVLRGKTLFVLGVREYPELLRVEIP